MPKKPSRIYQIKITLDDTHPPIWRRVLIPDNITLLHLHYIIQTTMGWENAHLHDFIIDEQYYGDPEDDEYGTFGTIDEKKMKLNEVIPGEKFRFSYEYDFGDGWEHTLLVEKILESEEGVQYPLCIKGKRACPPEDIGGVWGYENFLEAMSSPDHPERDEYSEWYGGEFDPETFDIEEVNLRLARISRTLMGNG